MQVIKKILIVSLLFILVTCSKDDGYGPAEINSGSSYSYNPPSSDYGSTSTTTSVTQYSLTVTAGTGGSVSTSGGTYNDGSSVSITATPNDGYEFSGWNGSNSTNSTISVTINSNTIIEALFTEIPITETTSTETTSTETSSTETSSTETTSTETTSSTYSITVTAQSSSNYILSGSDQNGDVSGNDPSVSAKVGDTLNFNLNSPGHPFYLIKVSNGGTDSNNLIDGVTNNGASSGTISWTPSEAGTYYYICEYHPSMLGTITITE